jgi:hypothetical protein
LSEANITGSASGKRTAQRTSCRREAGRGVADESGKADLEAFISAIPSPERAIITLPEISLNSNGTKVSNKVTADYRVQNLSQ